MKLIPTKNVCAIPRPWRHSFGTVVDLEFPVNRPLVVDLVFDDGTRTAETRTSEYALREDGYWEIARYVPLNERAMRSGVQQQIVHYLGKTYICRIYPTIPRFPKERRYNIVGIQRGLGKPLPPSLNYPVSDYVDKFTEYGG